MVRDLSLTGEHTQGNNIWNKSRKGLPKLPRDYLGQDNCTLLETKLSLKLFPHSDYRSSSWSTTQVGRQLCFRVHEVVKMLKETFL